MGKGSEEYGPEAALAEAARGGEGVCGASEEGVGEAVRGLGVGFWGGAFAGDFAEADKEEEEERKGGGGGAGERYEEMGAVGLRLRLRRWGLGDMAHRELLNYIKVESFVLV